MIQYFKKKTPFHVKYRFSLFLSIFALYVDTRNTAKEKEVILYKELCFNYLKSIQETLKKKRKVISALNSSLIRQNFLCVMKFFFVSYKWILFLFTGLTSLLKGEILFPMKKLLRLKMIVLFIIQINSSYRQIL